MCLPGEDQTYLRPQQWNILVPRMKQLQSAAHPTTPYGPLSFLFKKEQLDFWSKLAKPLAMPDLFTSLVQKERRMTRSAARTGHSSCPCLFECLPVDVLDMVIRKVANIDIIAIAMCSDVLWGHAMRYVQARLLGNVAPWAGMEIALTATYLQDLPESFTKNDLALRSVDRKRLPGGSMCMARQFNWAAITQYEHNVKQSGKVDDWLSVLPHHFSGKAEWERKYAVLQRCVASFRDGLFPPKMQAGHIWRLRNLTTKEFVRLHFLRKTDAQPVIDVPDAKWCRLDDILLLRICWTMKDSYGTPPDQGIWAGHCFDIIPTGTENLLTEWTDVTPDVADQARIFKALQSQWRLPPGIDLTGLCSSGIYRLGENNHIDYNSL